MLSLVKKMVTKIKTNIYHNITPHATQTENWLCHSQRELNHKIYRLLEFISKCAEKLS